MMSSLSATRQRRTGVQLSPRTRDALIVLAAAAAHALYLLLGWRATGAAAYPLDDSWIHQTYARNLALSGEWAFIPGVPSTGSTSVLWTLILVPGYLLPISAYVWTQLAGFAALAAAALGAARVFDDDRLGLSLAVGLAVALEWHMVWAAASGMETAFFAALVVWFWHWLRRHDPAATAHRWRGGLMLGVWGGVLMLARPEGVLALGVAGLYGLLCPGPLRDRLRWGAAAGAGFALLLVPFIGFNVLTSGAMWPNTFYAKQTEYSVIYEQAYVLRLWRQASVMFVGPLVLLLPGMIGEVWERVRSRVDLGGLVPLAWVLLHWAMYAARLPVTYQHGRYAIAVVPVLALYGIRGLARLARPNAQGLLRRALSRAWLLAAALIYPLTVAAFGAPAYARDNAFIQSEMVATAQWVEDNLPADAALAVHDIGALGFFSPRPLVDLAGLVSPDVVPLMHDAEGLAGYITASGADYLIVFPYWNSTYEDLIAIGGYEPVWATSRQPGYSGASELGPMTVYRATP